MISREDYHNTLDMDRFDAANKIVFENEGGSKQTNDKTDPGGLTKYGISKANNPDVDVANLDEAGAKKIAKAEYWDKYKIDLIKDDSLATHLYDMVYVQGKRGVRALQKAIQDAGVNIKVDGMMGSDTADALKVAAEKVGNKKIHELMASNRLKQFETIQSKNPEAYEKYKGGWTNRTMKMLDLFTKEK